MKMEDDEGALVVEVGEDDDGVKEVDEGEDGLGEEKGPDPFGDNLD